MTDREQLDQHIAVIKAIGYAIAKEQEIGPIGQSSRAVAEHHSRIERLKSVMDEHDRVASSIADQLPASDQLPAL
jgi:hypothetical protein